MEEDFWDRLQREGRYEPLSNRAAHLRSSKNKCVGLEISVQREGCVNSYAKLFSILLITALVFKYQG
jgi:hypothetical protein